MHYRKDNAGKHHDPHQQQKKTPAPKCLLRIPSMLRSTLGTPLKATCAKNTLAFRGIIQQN